jgi:23S rRNA (cytidine1920-2'-O)/16S rRNA (cytidine1409-2'-O)-methyltransferase
VTEKSRLDLLLVARGLAKSREEAQRLILAGEVRVGEHTARKASDQVSSEAEVAVGRRARFVSRGGDKLDGALESLAIDVTGRTALDVGASTGGFTDCLLSRGAVRVYAVDVGYGQLDWKLRRDPRVVVIERQNVRELDPATIAEPVALAVADVSFISLRLVLPKIAAIAVPGADVIALVKPQFEVGRGKVGKGGVVRESALQEEAVASVAAAADALGFVARGSVESSLRGPKGNREFFLWWTTPASR